jgi:hypothetical protein
MTSETVTLNQIIKELRELEPDRWTQVLDFIGYLKAVARAERETETELTAHDLLQSDLVGLWGDRDDLGESLAFARQLRQQAERLRNQYPAT